MRKLRLLITIIACLPITVIRIIQDAPIQRLSFELIITIAVFYAIGGILENYLKKKVFFNDNNIEGKEILTDETDVQIQGREDH